MKTLPLASTTKNTLLQETLETAYLVSDYYKALKNKTRLPLKPFPQLEKALQSQRILNSYMNNINLSIKRGFKMVNSALSETQVVWTWQQILSRSAKFNAGYNNSIN